MNLLNLSPDSSKVVIAPKSKNFSVMHTSGTKVFTLNGMVCCFPPLK